MSELLGDALLSIRTDDQGFSSGIDRAQARAENLGKAMDAASNTASALAEKLNDAGKGGDASAKAYQAAQTAISKLAAAQIDTAAVIGNAKAALDAGSISQQKYNEQVLQARTALQLVDAEYRAAVGTLRQHQDALNETSRVSGQSRMGMMVLGEQLRQVSTELSLGISPAQVFSQQIGQVVDATQLAFAGTGKFAQFMLGPWGIALTAGAAVVLPLLGNLLLAGNAVEQETEKLKENAKQAETARQAKEQFKRTEEGVTAAIEDQRAALDKQAKSYGTVAEAALRDAQQNLHDITIIRDKTLAILQQRQAELQGQLRLPYGAAGAEAAGEGANIAREQVAAAQLAVDDANKKLADAQKNLRDTQLDVAVEAGKRDTDTIKGINHDYDARIDKIKQAAKAENLVGDALERQSKQVEQQVAALEKKREAALKAAQAEKSGSNHQYGREITSSEARSIAEGAGFRVTDADRTIAQQRHDYETLRTPQNPVAYPNANAPHVRGDALDIAFGNGVDVESIRKAFTDAGVRLTKILKETGHFHIEWSTAGADKEAAAAKKAMEDAVRQQRNYAEASDQLDSQIAQAKRSALTDLDAIAALNEQQLRAEQDKFVDETEAKVKLGELTRADADQLELKQAELTRLKEVAAIQTTAAEKLKQQAQLDTELNQHQTEVLQAQLALAKTAEERRAIELQLLDLQKQEAKARYQLVIEMGKLGKATPAEVAAAQDGLNKLDTEYGLKREETTRQTAGPLESYLTGMKMSAAQLREKSESLAVDELEYFRKGIDDAITSRLGIKDPLIAGLVDQIVQQWLIKPMAEALSKVGGGGGGGIGGFLGSILGGGGGGLSSLVSSAESTISDPAFAGLFADGGLIPSGGWGIVGEAGPEPIFATNGGVGVLPNSALRQMDTGGGNRAVAVTVSGARGNAEIESMVRQGVAQGLAAYDRQVGERVRDNLARRG